MESDIILKTVQMHALYGKLQVKQAKWARSLKGRSKGNSERTRAVMEKAAMTSESSVRTCILRRLVAEPL